MVLKQFVKKVIRIVGDGLGLLTKKDVQTVQFWPIFNSRKELSDQIYRLTWYLPERKNRRLILFHKLGSSFRMEELFNEEHRPNYMHSMPLNLDNIESVSVETPLKRFLVYLSSVYHCVLGNYLVEWRHQNSFTARLLRFIGQVIVVDHTIQSYRSDVNYVTLQDRLENYSRLDQNESESRNLFNSLIANLKQEYSKTYIFGRGPSLEKVFDLDLSDGATIVVNQSVSNGFLLKHINPDIIIGGDHCWSYGCSKLSEKFRQDAISWVEKKNAAFVVPLDAYSLMLTQFPKLKGRLIGIPYGAEDHNFDLSSEYKTKGSLGVFFEFLFPIACTIGNEINMLGFDGNDVKEGETRDFKVPFSHYQKADYPEKILQTIYDSRPGYYDRDQSNFRDEFDVTFTDIIEKAQAKNFIIKTLAPSYHSVLKAK